VRALLRTDRADDELARALAAAGLYVERVSAADAPARLLDVGDLAVIDPRLLPLAAPSRRPAGARAGAEPSVESSPLEELCYRRLAAVLDKLDGGTLPELYATAMAQSERALLRLAIDRTKSLSAGAELLGIHRNTLVRRLGELGLRSREDGRADDAGEPRAGKRREARPAAAGAKASAPRKAASGQKPKVRPAAPSGKRRKAD